MIYNSAFSEINKKDKEVKEINNYNDLQWNFITEEYEEFNIDNYEAGDYYL